MRYWLKVQEWPTTPTAVTAAADGSKLAELRYSAFGEIRFSTGTTPTEYQYTGQLNASYIKLSWYNSRWYDNEFSQFIQPDTIIPNLSIPGAWNRYFYVLGNPINKKDPTGHFDVGAVASNAFSVKQLYVSSGIRIPGIVSTTTQYVPTQISTYQSTQQSNWNNCGPWAASLENSTVREQIERAALAYRFARENNTTSKPSDNYPDYYGGSGGGVQPSDLYHGAKDVYEARGGSVSQQNNATFSDILFSLQAGDEVIVDLLVSNNQSKPAVPFTDNDATYAHFARVIGVDLTKNEIYLTNSVKNGQSGGSYWTLSQADFNAVTTDPEGKATLKSGQTEIVNQWILVVHPGGQ